MPLTTRKKSQSNRTKKKTVSKGHGLEAAAELSLPQDFELSPEFQAAFRSIETTNKNIYITGVAGTGKTTLLKYFRQESQKNFVVLAPTGIAAINSHGQTIHSFFKFPPKMLQAEHIRRVYNAQKVFTKLDLLIVDEASMMRADIMDAIDYSLRVNKDNMLKPFGGVQIVLFGDLFQLPPIIERDLSSYYSQRYETPYFFSANIFRGVAFHHFDLTKVYRQRDRSFAKLLDKIRHRDMSEEDMEMLNSRVDPELCESVEDCITLTTTNAAANAINEMRLRKLEGKEYAYEAKIENDFTAAAFPTETKLRLKAGAQVLMIKNDRDKRWVNGSIGEVIELEEGYIRVRIGNEVHDVMPEVWQKIKYKYDKPTEKIVEEVTGSFEQYPIKLAWAITIHKSQGLTFDKVIVDLSGGAFAHGQVYVALSRCRSLEGLILKRPVRARDIIFDDRIHRIIITFRSWIPTKGA